MKLVYVYRRFERFWHWTQAFLILFLAFTGFEIHGEYRFFGFGDAVKYHNVAAIALLVLIVFAIFWHAVTGEWKQYVPTLHNVRKQLDYYLVGIFRNAPHPAEKTPLSKLNPLQKLVYAGLKLLVIPVTVSTGLMYMFYRNPQQIRFGPLPLVATLHTLGAFLLMGFLVVHLYLMTTGHTATSNLKAMITGYEEIPDHEPQPVPETAAVRSAS